MHIPSFIILDDDTEDIEILRKAFSNYDNVHIDYFTDARRLLAWLEQCTDDSLPKKIFTDLNMPYLSGYEFLMKLRSNPRFQTIDITILSTSNENTEIEKCKHLGASNYIVKPGDYTGYKQLAKRIVDAA